MTDETFPCPHCGQPVSRIAEDDSQGVTCPSCGVMIMSSTSPQDVSPVAPSPPPPAHVPLPPMGTPDAVSPTSQADALGKLRLVGVFSIIAGVLSMLAVVVYAFIIFAVMQVPEEAFGSATEGNPQATLPMLIAVYAIPAILSLPTGILQLMGGVKLLKQGAGAYGWGMAAAIANVSAIWLCCGYLLTLPAGIYTFVVLSDPTVKQVLHRR